MVEESEITEKKRKGKRKIEETGRNAIVGMNSGKERSARKSN